MRGCRARWWSTDLSVRRIFYWGCSSGTICKARSSADNNSAWSLRPSLDILAWRLLRDANCTIRASIGACVGETTNSLKTILSRMLHYQAGIPVSNMEVKVRTMLRKRKGPQPDFAKILQSRKPQCERVSAQRSTKGTNGRLSCQKHRKGRLETGGRAKEQRLCPFKYRCSSAL